MVIDVHCHVGFSARRADQAIPRFSFEPQGATGTTGFDSYFSPRLLARPAWFFVRRWLGIPPRLDRGDELDARIAAINQRHFAGATSVDRLVLLAFDEYHDDAGRVIGAAASGQRFGSDLYVSNSLVRAMCAERPDRFLFGASIHPYRRAGERDACDLLREVAATGPVLVKWLPIHQNIRIDDPRTIRFCREAARLHIPLLIHYGGEMSLSRQHMEFESPVPLLGVLRDLRREGAMPTVIVAHVATPSFIWQSRAGHDALVEALLGEFRDAPLYADISALAAFGRAPWLRRLRKRRELHSKLLFGSDFPIPVMQYSFRWSVSRQQREELRTITSWIEQAYRLVRMLGFDDSVFTSASQVLPLSGSFQAE